MTEFGVWRYREANSRQSGEFAMVHPGGGENLW